MVDLNKKKGLPLAWKPFFAFSTVTKIKRALQRSELLLLGLHQA